MPLSATHATLALMISLQPPGKSPYSRIALERCDEDCQKTPICDEPVLWCKPPHWSGKHQRFMRYENFEEAVRRYLLVADVMRDASDNMVWKGHGRCAPPGQKRPKDDKACAAARRRRPFTGTERQLRLLLTTVTYYESTFRRDVHSGETRGDCKYREVNGRRVRIEGSCRSHCLGQVKLDGKERTRRKYDRDDIVGVSRAATKRCIETVVDHLSTARNVCTANRRPGSAAHPACIIGVYGGVRNWDRDPRIQKRYKTYLELSRAKPKLGDEVKKILGIEEE